MRREYDKPLLVIVAFLLVGGFFILLSASFGMLNREGEQFFTWAILKQLFLGIGGGVILMSVCSKIHYKKWKKYSFIFFILSLFITLLVFFPGIGFEHGGARRWIDLGPVSFQPSELLKFSFVVYLAAWIDSRRREIKSFKFGLVPFLVIILLVAFLLIAQPDFGTLGVMGLTALVLFFLGGGRLSQIAVMIALGILGLYLFSFLHPYAMKRILAFINPDYDPLGAGWQIKQSLIAIGSGGIFGRGFGMSIQKFKYLPEPMGDSIFAVFAEEFGFVGSIILIFAFLAFLTRSFKVIRNVQDTFARLLGSGIVILIIIQAFVNIGAMIQILPLTGLPLTFISKGGTALAITLAQVGVLLNISRYQQ